MVDGGENIVEATWASVSGKDIARNTITWRPNAFLNMIPKAFTFIFYGIKKYRYLLHISGV